MKENIFENIAGDSFKKLTKTRPSDMLPSLTHEGTVMPGEEFVGGMTMIGDHKVADMIAGGGYSKPDLATIIPHYARGLVIKDQLGNKLQLGDRQQFGDCALGYGLNSHYYIDEFGLSLTEDKPFPDYIVDAAKKYMIKQTAKARYKLEKDSNYEAINLDNYSNVKSSYPRGKNSGLPWIISGTDRFQSDLGLAANALLSQLLIEGQSTDKVFKDLLISYVVFSRYQRTTKNVPLMLERPASSYLFEPRRRVVNGTPKAMAMVVKPLVKWATVTGLETDVFTQDRDVIRKRIASGHTFASDASRFDLRSGGVKLKQGLQLLWDVAKHFHDVPQTVYEIMMEEAFLPTLAVYGYPESQLYETDAPALRSGASTTSRVGSLINLMYDMVVESSIEDTKDPDVIAHFYDKYAPSIILSDDLLKTYDKVPDFSDRMAKYEEHLKILSSVGMSAEIERPTKFLGYNINSVKDDGKYDLFHSSSPLDNMFFPERFKSNATASMMMRYIITKKHNAMSALDAMTDVMRNPRSASQWYKAFYDDCYASLAEHYSTHPSGAARQFFATLPGRDADASVVSKNIMKDIDEILIFLSKGSAYDFNYALIGLPEINDLIEKDLGTLTASANDLVNMGKKLVIEHKTGKTISTNTNQGVRTDVRQKFASRNAKINDVVGLFMYEKPDDIINHYHSMLPRIARRVATFHGDVYVGNL